LVEFYYLWKKTPGANNNRPHRRNRRQQSLRRIRNTRNTRGGQPKEADANSPAGTIALGVSCFAGKGVFPAIEITVEDNN
jgi:arginine-glutamic acid dipeptide repeat-containing protein